MGKVHYISSQHLSFARVSEIISEEYELALSDEAKEKILTCRNYLDKKMTNNEHPIYGINTGFGSLCNTSISKEDLGTLQKNLVMSHACGMGDEVPAEVVRLMLLLKIQSLSYGHSGVQLATVERLIAFFNEDILPVVYQSGSLGASGDLAPLAHLSLPLINLGEVSWKGKRMSGAEMNEQMNFLPIELMSKEGLALLNGTQFMGAYAAWSVLKGEQLIRWADLIGALSLDAYDGRIDPFYDSVHQVRHHKGQIETARKMREYLQDSELIARPKAHVQDPYSFRCIPQVHGATKDSLTHATGVVEDEMNAVTDNPTIFPDEDVIVSAGNFHGQPLALVLDFMAIAMAELGNISERRIYQLISGKRDLPSFLVAKPGLNSGFMIPQYAAASMVSKNKQLATPASVDSIESSQGQEDHVSMGANSATKLYQVLQNVERVLATELFNAAQALEFRRPAKSSAALEQLVANFRKHVPFVEKDQTMYNLMQKSVDFMQQTTL
ncbi:MAG: histidine ammonia-lyase [Bacteroidales bacterium]